jgi:hypothetical protein
MPHPSHSSRFYYLNNIGWGMQIIKLLIMYFSPLPCLFRKLILLTILIQEKAWYSSVILFNSVRTPQMVVVKWHLTKNWEVVTSLVSNHAATGNPSIVPTW